MVQAEGSLMMATCHRVPMATHRRRRLEAFRHSLCHLYKLPATILVMTSVSIFSTMPAARRRKSIARLFGAFTVPANEAQRASRLRDGCIIPLDLDYVRPDCLLPAEIASLYAETERMQNESSSHLTSMATVPKATIYVRLNYVRIAAYEDQSVEFEIGIFDQNTERFVTDNVILNSSDNSLSDWVGFVGVDITPSCVIVLRIFAVGALVKNCSSIRLCRRQIGFSSSPLSCIISEAPLAQHELPVSSPKNDRQFAKLLSSSPVINRYRYSMAFKLRLQAANIIPSGTTYRAVLSHPLSPCSLIRFDLISGSFKNQFKTSQMNICVEASVIVRDDTNKEIVCLSRGSGELKSTFSSLIVYHCNSPAFHESFSINIDAIRSEAPNAHVSLLLQALHVARCGTVTIVGYTTLKLLDMESGKIATTNNQVVASELLDITDNRRTKNRIYFRSAILSKHDTDDDILALILTGKALLQDLQLAHARIQISSNVDLLLQKKLMEAYITKGSYRKDATLNAAWSLYCLLRQRLLNTSGVCLPQSLCRSQWGMEPIQADILLTNIILCLRFNAADLIHLSLEIFDDPSSIVITELSKDLAYRLSAEAFSGPGFVRLSSGTIVLLFKLLARLLKPDDLRSAFDTIVLTMQRSDESKFIRSRLNEVMQLDHKADRTALIKTAIRYASSSDEACCCFAKPLSALLHIKFFEYDLQTLLILLRRLLKLVTGDRSSQDVSVLIIQIVKVLHLNHVTISSHELRPYLAFVSRIANTSAFDPSQIILRVMEIHAATLIMDMLPSDQRGDPSVPRALLMLLNGKDMHLYGIRKRRSTYIGLHVHQWLRPFMVNILKKHSDVNPDLTTLELLIRLMIRERFCSDDMLAMLKHWKSRSRDCVFELALCNQAFLTMKERWLYPNATDFFKQLVGAWENQSFFSCFICLSEAAAERNTDRQIDALVSALNSVRHISEAMHIRLYIINELICLYDSLKLIGPELAQCYIERGENQPLTDSGRLNDFRRALQISTDCFQWEKAATICERIIYGCTVPDRDPSFNPCFRKLRADLVRRIQTEDRVIPQFARVAFSSSSLHHRSERGREFVYRLKTGESVLEFTDHFRKQYWYAEIKNSFFDSAVVESAPIIAIQRVEVCHSTPPEEGCGDADTDSLSLPLRFRQFAMHSDGSMFSFARLEIIPSNADGKRSGPADVSDQWYEIHRVAITNRLPFISRRQPIIDHKKYWQSPIQTAILTVRQGTQKLEREMQKILFSAKQKDGSIDVSQLSLVLSGIIDAPVNGGIAIYRSSFLSDSERYSDEQQELLNAIKNQKCVLKKGLNLFKDSISASLMPLFSHLEIQLEKTFPNS